jgi:hypothetical protein
LIYCNACVDNGIAGNIEIHYNTNGTHYPENAEEIWKHFKLVEVAFQSMMLVKDLNINVPALYGQKLTPIWIDLNSCVQKYKHTVTSVVQLLMCLM